MQVPSWTVWDANFSYDITDQQFINLNVRNLFDRDPPRVLGLSSNVDQINHNSMGRFWTLRYTFAF